MLKQTQQLMMTLILMGSLPSMAFAASLKSTYDITNSSVHVRTETSFASERPVTMQSNHIVSTHGLALAVEIGRYADGSVAYVDSKYDSQQGPEETRSLVAISNLIRQRNEKVIGCSKGGESVFCSGAMRVGELVTGNTVSL